MKDPTQAQSFMDKLSEVRKSHIADLVNGCPLLVKRESDVFSFDPISKPKSLKSLANSSKVKSFGKDLKRSTSFSFVPISLFIVIKFYIDRLEKVPKKSPKYLFNMLKNSILAFNAL